MECGMEWSFHRHHERRREGRAAALEDVHGKRPRSRLESQAQAGGCGFIERFPGPPQRHEGAAGLGSNSKAPQLRVTGMGQPGEQRMTALGTQYLLGSPERIAPARGAHDGKVRKVDACSSQRRRIGQVRRGEPHHTLARCGEGCERRQDELELANAMMLDEDFG